MTGDTLWIVHRAFLNIPVNAVEILLMDRIAFPYHPPKLLTPLSKNVTNNIELASRVTAPEPAQHDVNMMLPSCCCLLAAANYEAYYSAIAITHHHTYYVIKTE